MLPALGLVLVAVAPQADTIRLAERLCRTCTVEARPLVTLGDGDGFGALGPAGLLTRDSAGRYLLVHQAAAAQLTVFSSEGRYLRTVGRPGGGPGEYRRIWYVAQFSSGIVVYDDFSRRSTRLAHDFSVVDTRPAPETPTSVLLRHDGSGIMSAIVPTSELIGYTLHEFDGTRTRTRSLALNPLPYREDLRDLFLRDLARGVDTSAYWVSHRREYAVEYCTLTGTACTTYVRPVPWFPKPNLADPWDSDIIGDNPPPPPPRLVGVSQESDRYLWVIAWAPDTRWRSGVETHERTEYRILDLNRLYDTVIERVDLLTGHVVVSARVDAALRQFVGSTDAWYYHETREGVGRVEVVRLTVSDKSTP